MEHIEILEEQLEELRLDYYNAKTQTEKDILEAEIEDIKFEIKLARRYARRGR